MAYEFHHANDLKAALDELPGTSAPFLARSAQPQLDNDLNTAATQFHRQTDLSTLAT
jgi:hypothetical protein